MEPHASPAGPGPSRTWGLAAVGAALTASVCCTLPFLLAAVGVGGALVASLGALEPLQAPLSALAVGALGLAFWRSGRTGGDDPGPGPTPGGEQGSDCACDEPRRTQGRAFLWGAAAVVAVLLASPALIGLAGARPDPALQAAAGAGEADVVIRVEGMTCQSCATGLQATLRRTEGVLAATVTMEPPVARIRYDDRRTTPAALVAAVEAAGYRASLASNGAEGAPAEATPAEAAPAAGLLPVGARCNVRGHDHTLDAANAEPMAPITTAALRDAFNANAGEVRLVALLSPACAGCVHGHAVVADVLGRHPDAALKGLVVWLPMVEGDSPRMATAQAGTLADSRLVAQGWDGERATGAAFERTLGLAGPAWDVYLVYAPGVRWEGETPPAPTFWMHQLEAAYGADQRLCLNPEVLEREVVRLL